MGEKQNSKRGAYRSPKECGVRLMIKSTYTAYAVSGETVKAGTVTHEVDIDDDPRGPINFLEAVVADVGEERWENDVFGVRE